jgi:hypothetical protein
MLDMTFAKIGKVGSSPSANNRAHVLELRLQYLVSKGAILRKGQRIKTKFCKFSATPQGACDLAFPSEIPARTDDEVDRPKLRRDDLRLSF